MRARDNSPYIAALRRAFVALGARKPRSSDEFAGARRATEPMVGLEPTACCLRNSCSTTELHRHVSDDTEWTEPTFEADGRGTTAA